MPEGPTLVILKEEVQAFKGKKIIVVNGDTKIDKSRLLNLKVLDFKTWGKHFLICFKDFTVRVHLLMFGSYTINEAKPSRQVKLKLGFSKGEINLYNCSIKVLEGDINSHYDWTGDVMNSEWDNAKARAKLKLQAKRMICDALLDQDIFAGVGNIIKNEILYRVKVHPESSVAHIPTAKINTLIREARIYSFQFLEWKKKNELKKHWLAHTQKICSTCQSPIIKKYTGTKKRRSFICEKCQKLY